MAEDPRDRSGFREMKTALQDHQIGRLKETYSDLMADPQYTDMAQFFFEDLYHVGDIQARNRAFLKLYRYLEKIFELRVLHGLKSLMDFYFLSERLDDEVALVLMKMGTGLDFTRDQYNRAYRIADNHEDRVQQLAVCDESLRFVHRMSHLPFFGGFIKSAQLTARLIGATEMTDFLGRGYQIFKKVASIDYFAGVIAERERDRLEEIWRRFPTSPKIALTRKEREGLKNVKIYNT